MTKGDSTLDVRAFINERSISTNQWLLVVLCFLIVTVDGIDVAIMGFIASSITAEWGLSKAAFGIVMGAAPIGLAIGAVIAGSSSDWFGRRKVLLASVAGFGLCTLASASAENITQMAVMRLLTGLGLGAAMPNTTTLLTEYVPERSRSFLIALMFTGFNLGSALIGFCASYLVPNFGWRSVLIFGGVLPLAMLPFLYRFLPESACFMAVKGMAAARIRDVLGTICSANLDRYTRFVSNEQAPASKQPLSILFSAGYGWRTIALWTTYFMGLLVIYLATSWLPTMMQDAGLTVDKAAQVTAMFQLGGTVGAVLVGMAMDRFGPSRIVGLTYFVGAIALLVFGRLGVESAWLVFIVATVGFFLSGAQTGLNAFAPSCYPTVGRATGVSWMLGVGRLGSILGSSIGGVLLSFGLGFESIFTILAVPAIIAAVAIFSASGLPASSPLLRDDLNNPPAERI